MSVHFRGLSSQYTIAKVADNGLRCTSSGQNPGWGFFNATAVMKPDGFEATFKNDKKSLKLVQPKDGEMTVALEGDPPVEPQGLTPETKQNFVTYGQQLLKRLQHALAALS